MFSKGKTAINRAHLPWTQPHLSHGHLLFINYGRLRRVRLAKVSATKKSVVETQVFTEGSLAACAVDRWSPRDPLAAGDPHTSSEAERNPDPQGRRSGHLVSILPTLSPRSLTGTQVKEVQGPHHSDDACKKKKPMSSFHLEKVTRRNNLRVSVQTFLACISTRLSRSSSGTPLASAVICSAVVSLNLRGNSFAYGCSA
ncbi:hypothetical protein Cgig2_021908 [Carnegiea gigantea]|uniref:Uncharacterized protein n=1 Tax=Carnegiea gigantea TaxID=171969 RepID=A0A9Q1Q8I3_9CARY|nr:hypothetical protein Cgig2_021908 [Carnegiea gigantea]